MRQSKFTETQIVSILKEADAGRPVNDIWRTYDINSATHQITAGHPVGGIADTLQEIGGKTDGHSLPFVGS